MSEVEDIQVRDLHSKIDRLLQQIGDMQVQMAKMSTAQDFMAENQKSRIRVEEEMNKRISAIENKLNYATGIAVAAAAIISFTSSFITKKLFG